MIFDRDVSFIWSDSILVNINRVWKSGKSLSYDKTWFRFCRFSLTEVQIQNPISFEYGPLNPQALRAPLKNFKT